MDGNPPEVSIMNWKFHITLSLFLYFLIILFFQFSLLYCIQAVLVTIFSSFLPDIDHPKSVIRKATFITVFYFMALAIVMELTVGMWMKILIMAITLVITYYFYRHIPLKHRGKRSLHLWRYLFVFPTISAILFALASINISLILFIIVGYGSHLLLDKVNKF